MSYAQVVKTAVKNKVINTIKNNNVTTKIRDGALNNDSKTAKHQHIPSIKVLPKMIPNIGSTRVLLTPKRLK